MFKIVGRGDEKAEKEIKRDHKDGKVTTTLLREKNELGNTALHYAAKAGNLKVCKVLVEMGAIIEVKNDNEMTPPEFAARYGDGNAKDVFNCIMWLNQDRTKNNKDERTKMTKEKTEASN